MIGCPGLARGPPVHWADTRAVVLSIAHGHNLKIYFRLLTYLLKMFLNVGLQTKCSRHIGNGGRRIHFS